MAVGLHGPVGFFGFTEAGSIFSADFGVTFPVVGIDRLDGGGVLVEIVEFADSCNLILDAAGKSIVN